MGERYWLQHQQGVQELQLRGQGRLHSHQVLTHHLRHLRFLLQKHLRHHPAQILENGHLLVELGQLDFSKLGELLEAGYLGEALLLHCEHILRLNLLPDGCCISIRILEHLDHHQLVLQETGVLGLDEQRRQGQRQGVDSEQLHLLLKETNLVFYIVDGVVPGYFHWLSKKLGDGIFVLGVFLLSDGHVVLQDVEELLLKELEFLGLHSADGGDG